MHITKHQPSRLGRGRKLGGGECERAQEALVRMHIVWLGGAAQMKKTISLILMGWGCGCNC